MIVGAGTNGSYLAARLLEKSIDVTLLTRLEGYGHLYSLLGATWLIWKTEGHLQNRAFGFAWVLAFALLLAIGIVSLWTPLPITPGALIKTKDGEPIARMASPTSWLTPSMRPRSLVVA